MQTRNLCQVAPINNNILVPFVWINSNFISDLVALMIEFRILNTHNIGKFSLLRKPIFILFQGTSNFNDNIMIKFRLLLLASLIALTSCNQSKKEVERYNDTLDKHFHLIPIPFTGEYPKVIDSLNVEDFYNEVKWDMYCLMADVNCNYNGASQNYFTKATLKYEGCILNEDTISLFFGFYYPDSIRLIRPDCQNSFLVHGAKFIIKGKNYFRYLFAAAEIDSGLYTDRKINGVNYIQAHKTELNPWLYLEVEKRSLINR